MYHRRSLIRHAIVSWSSDGVVEGIETCENIDAQAGVEYYNGILLPDLVDAHCHLELSYLRDAIPQGGGFTAFARDMGRVRDIADRTEKLRAAEDADRALWHQGVGAVGDVGNGSLTFGIKRRSPVAYLNFVELFGLAVGDAETLIPVMTDGIGTGMRCVVTPHSTYSLQDAAFRSAVGYGPCNRPLSIHFMESPAERELFEGCGSLYEWYGKRGLEIDFAGYGSPARRITSAVPADRDILLVHNCCVTEEDVDIILSHFTGRVTWVLCPRSNRYISRMEPPVELLRRKGVNIAVGTDSLASNTSLDMVAELRALGNVPLEELLDWVTLNGAMALGLGERFAGFEKGSASGAVLLSGVDWDSMALTDASRTERIF